MGCHWSCASPISMVVSPTRRAARMIWPAGDHDERVAQHQLAMDAALRGLAFALLRAKYFLGEVNYLFRLRDRQVRSEGWVLLDCRFFCRGGHRGSPFQFQFQFAFEFGM